MDDLDNPVIKPDLDMAALEAAADKADHGQDYSAEIESIKNEPLAEETLPEEITQPTEPEQKTVSRDEQGRFTKSDGSKSEPGEQAPAEQPSAEAKPVEPAKEDTAFAKAKKERDRQENLLKNFESEKQRARAELAQQKAQIDQERAQFEAQRRNPQARDKFTSAEYADFRNQSQRLAKKAFEDGDYEKAQEHIDNAEKAEVAAGQAYQNEQQEGQQNAQKNYWDAWRGNMEKTIHANREFGNPESPIAKEIQEVLKMPDILHPGQPNVFERLPDGFAYAAEVAKLRLEAREAAQLRLDMAKMKAENDRLTKLTSISPSGPATHAGPKNFNNMSLDDMSRHVERQAAMADAN